MSIRIYIGACILAIVGSTTVNAAPVLLLSGVELVGATGIDVGGTLYNVTFVDGNCVDLFGGCDTTSDFVFQTQLDADTASQALLDTVFLNGDPSEITLQYDLFPGLTFGCEGTFSAEECRVITPYQTELVQITGPSGPELRTIVSASLAVNTSLIDLVGGVTADRDAVPDLQTSGGAYVWAIWTPAGDSVPVPEPGSLVLLSLGLAGGLIARRQRRLGSQT